MIKSRLSFMSRISWHTRVIFEVSIRICDNVVDSPVFNWGVYTVLFPSSSLPLFIIDFLTTLLLLHLKMTTPFAQYIDGMMGERPLLNRPLKLVGFYLKTYLASLTDRTLFRTLLAIASNATSPSLVGGLMKPTKM